MNIEKATKGHVYVQCFSLFSPSLKGTPEVWHHSWLQLSLKYLQGAWEVIYWDYTGQAKHLPLMNWTYSYSQAMPISYTILVADYWSSTTTYTGLQATLTVWWSPHLAILACYTAAHPMRPQHFVWQQRFFRRPTNIFQWLLWCP